MSHPATRNEKLQAHLLAIYQICSEHQVARAKEIAARLNVRPYAVTAALRTLGEMGLINYAPYDVITLTPAGEKKARLIQERQAALENFFIQVLGADQDEAKQAAASLEVHMPQSILDRMIRFPRPDSIQEENA